MGETNFDKVGAAGGHRSGSADLNEAELETIDESTAGTASALKALVLGADKDVTGLRNIPSVARTATVAGATTGTIADAGSMQFVTVTSSNADHIVILPAPTPGTIVILHVGANGFELRSSAPATVAINGGAEADAESAIAANSTVIAICVSATAWKAFFLDADSDVAKVEAAAAA